MNKRDYVDKELPQLTSDEFVMREDLNIFGYCLIENALTADELNRLQKRLIEQAEMEWELHNQQSQGRVWVADYYYIENRPKEIYDLLAKAESRSENSVVVNVAPRFDNIPRSETKLEPSNDPLSIIDDIELADLNFNSATFQVHTNKSALFVWADSYYPRWTVAVNHEKVQIL